MASSPLEIYEKAYRLHYDDNDVQRACDLYKQLISEFPDTAESAYAAIQLQKIDAEDLIRRLGKRKPAVVLMTVTLIFCVATLIAFGILGLVFYQKTQIETRKAALIAQAIGLMHLNRDVDALRFLQEAKGLETRDISPYALSADIYLRRGDVVNARAEYQAYNRRFSSQSGYTVPDLVTAPSGSPGSGATKEAETGGEGRKSSGDHLSDKNSVIRFLDSVSSAP